MFHCRGNSHHGQDTDEQQCEHKHEVEVEGETGKVYRANFHDRHGRTVLILRPGLQNTSLLDNQTRHLVHLIENAILNVPEGQEQMAWLIDFTGWSLSNNVPIKSAREISRSVFVQLSTYIRSILEGCKVLLGYPKTFQKVKFVCPKNKDSVELIGSYFDSNNLPSEFGGKATLQYDHEVFLRQMAQDDVKAAKLWGFREHQPNGRAGAEVSPEPKRLAP